MSDPNKASLGVAIVILAAGASTRMNAVKQLLPWGNETLLNHAIQQALGAGAQQVYVVLGANFELIEKSIKTLSVTILKNKNWAKGLGTSIACAIKYFRNHNLLYSGVLVSLADQPFLTSLHLKALITCFENNNATGLVATQYPDKKGAPAIFPSIYYRQLSALTEDCGAKGLLAIEDKVIAIGAEGKVFDVDTKSDYQHAISQKNPDKIGN